MARKPAGQTSKPSRPPRREPAIPKAAAAAAGTSRVAQVLGSGGLAGVSATARAEQAAATAPIVPLLKVSAAATILDALDKFLAAKAERDRQFIGEIVLPIVQRPGDVAALADEELGREAEFNRRARVRVENELPKLLAIDDQDKRAARLAAVLDREKRYAGMRTQAMATRAVRAADRSNIRRDSPLGAFWLLDPTVAEHTAGCLVMGMKFWPWEVLDRVHPPRHPACPCKLVSHGSALAQGLMGPADVPDVETAIRAAAGVVMEAEEAEAILAERSEVLEELRRRGTLIGGKA